MKTGHFMALGLALAMGFASTQSLAADAAAGEAYMNKKCKNCHTWDKGGKNKVGPNLFGVIARGAGKVEKFKYSKGFDGIGAWDDAVLDEYLTDPKKFAKAKGTKTRMTWKTKKADDRANVIEYLKTLK